MVQIAQKSNYRVVISNICPWDFDILDISTCLGKSSHRQWSIPSCILWYHQTSFVGTLSFQRAVRHCFPHDRFRARIFFFYFAINWFCTAQDFYLNSQKQQQQQQLLLPPLSPPLHVFPSALGTDPALHFKTPSIATGFPFTCAQMC